MLASYSDLRWPAEFAPRASEERCPAELFSKGLSSLGDCTSGPARVYPRLSGKRPELRLGYPLNLSILVSGGIETKQDSPSNGERTGKSSRLKSGRLRPDLWRLDLAPVAAQM